MAAEADRMAAVEAASTVEAEVGFMAEAADRLEEAVAPRIGAGDLAVVSAAV